MELYTLPSLPLYFVLKDEDGKWWIVPANLNGKPRTPYTGYIAHLERMMPSIERVVLRAWGMTAEAERRLG